MGRLDAESETLIPTIGGVFDVTPFDTTQITSPANYSHPQAGDACHPLAAKMHPPAIAFAIQAGALRTNPGSGPAGTGVRRDLAYTLEAQSDVQCVAFAHQAGGTQTTLGYDPDAGVSPTLAKCQTPAIDTGMAVRRLTPTECERLQGFPDGYTDIRHGGKVTPDGPRYKACGNSMAIPPMRWIGRRIALVDSIHVLQAVA